MKVIAILLLFVSVWILQVFAVFLIWNGIMPDLFGLPSITLWQALLLRLLTRVLIGIGSGVSKKE